MRSNTPHKINDLLSQGDVFPVSLKPRPLSRLTYKILSFNLLVVFILAMGVSYLGNTRQSMIELKLANLEQETFSYAQALSIISDQRARLDLLKKIADKGEQQFVLFSDQGAIISSFGSLPVSKVDELRQQPIIPLFDRAIIFISDLFSVTFHLPELPNLETSSVILPNEDIISGDGIHISAWSSADGGLILTSFSPILSDNIPVAYLRVARRALDVEKNFSETRLHVIRFLGLAMLMTIAHSLYLAGLIGHPLRKLAVAAEAYRLNRGRHVEIPDMSARQDEIGELSHSMREMALALQKRLSSIEQFAADVSHEIKNPLTSLHSALETLPRAKKEEDKNRLIDVALHDLQRMDRLISDISQASRLDAELSRNDLFRIDLRDVVLPLIDSHRDPILRGTNNIPALSHKIICTGLDHPVYILGQIGRLEQVFQNLISNALSFAPEGTQVMVTIDKNHDRVKISIDDQGPGIPENRLDKVFHRFYSERPVSENFGMHSGLGLSIAKQIIDAHGGTITAENRKDGDGHILGARFIVRIKNAD